MKIPVAALCVGKERARKIRLREISADEFGLTKIGVAGRRVTESGVRKTGEGEIPAVKLRVLERCAVEPGSLHARTAQVRPVQPGAAQVDIPDIEIAQVRPAQIDAAEARCGFDGNAASV